jgi:hypothetical protein
MVIDDCVGIAFEAFGTLRHFVVAKVVDVLLVLIQGDLPGAQLAHYCLFEESWVEVFFIFLQRLFLLLA